MARPSHITDEQIIEAAHTVFLDKGLNATALEIAQHAGISEGTIFKRFKTKEQLFAVAMTRGTLTAPWFLSLDELSGRGCLRSNLLRIAHEMITFFDELIPKTQMMMAHHGHVKDLLTGHPQSPPLVALRRLVDFIETEQRVGRMRPCHPELLARLLMSSMHHYAWFNAFDINQWLDLSLPEYVRQTTSHLFGHLIVDSS